MWVTRLRPGGRGFKTAFPGYFFCPAQVTADAASTAAAPLSVGTPPAFWPPFQGKACDVSLLTLEHLK